MKKVTAQFDGNANSMEALTAKQKVYNERADEQRKKVELMTTALENAKKEYGENSDKVKDWQIKLNNAEADLAKTEKTLQSNEKAIKEYGKAQIQAAKDSEEFKKAQDKLKGAMNGLKVAAIAVTGAIVGFAGLAVKAGMAADDINTLAKQTGLTTEEIQKFQYATDLIDVPIETLTGSMAKLTKNMGTAQKGTGDAADAFKALGISITDQDGNLRDNQDVFNEAINALGKMENATQRDAYAMQIFGKSAQDLNPLILGGADDLKKYGEQAEKMGLILSQDALDGLNAINDKADELKGVFGLAGAAIVSEFAPQINEALASIDVGKIVEDIKGL
jgi:chromosome segregation ATPase